MLLLNNELPDRKLGVEDLKEGDIIYINDENIEVTVRVCEVESRYHICRRLCYFSTKHICFCIYEIYKKYFKSRFCIPADENVKYFFEKIDYINSP